MNTAAQILIRQALTALAGFLVSKNITDQANATVVANGLAPAVLLLVSFVWSHLHLSKVSNPSPTSSGSANSILSLLLGSLIIAGFLQGCTSPPARIAYNTVAAPAVSVDAAMTLWGDYVAQYHPTAATELKVKAAFERYQKAELLAIDAAQAYAALSASASTNSVAQAARLNSLASSQLASNALADLVNLLRNIGVKI